MHRLKSDAANDICHLKKIIGARSYEYPGDPAKRQVCARWPRCTETRNLPVIVATLKNADIDDVPTDDEKNMDT